MKLNFKNDYSHIAHPKVLEHLLINQTRYFNGYGLDDVSDDVIKTIKAKIQKEVDVHFLVGGTSVNKIAIAHALKPYEAVISVESGHINVHETGAIEANGHKILIVDGVNGKITPIKIVEMLIKHTDEHMVIPKMVYISNATEIGSVYSKDELKAISKICKTHDLFLYMDGARLSAAMVESGLTLDDYAQYCDMFTIGGTKNGLMMGEVLIITNPKLFPNLRFTMKQNGGMLAKGFLLGLQFQSFFKDDLYLDLAKHANDLAKQIQNACLEIEISLASQTITNQIFLKLTHHEVSKLKQKVIFEVWNMDDSEATIRLVTSWATKEEEVKQLIKILKSIKDA